jgi:cathepsin D
LTAVGDDDSRDTATINYAMGEATGLYVRDAVCVGGISSSIACAKADFVATTEESDNPFTDSKFDGIFGLSLSSISEMASREFNVADQLFMQKSVSKPVFAVYLGRRLHDAGELTFGNWKPARMADPLHWVNVSDPGYWQFTVDDVLTNGTSMGVCNGKKGCQTVIDTGSSLLMGPKAMIDPLMKLLNSHIKNCDDLSRLPTISFRLGGVDLQLTPDDYMDASHDTCLFAFMECPDTGKGPLIVLGMPFLRKYYTVFDFTEDHPRLGFSLANHNASTVSSQAAADGSKSVDIPLTPERNYTQ